jgi:hypothetical protein
MNELKERIRKFQEKHPGGMLVKKIKRQAVVEEVLLTAYGPEGELADHLVLGTTVIANGDSYETEYEDAEQYIEALEKAYNEIEKGDLP